MTKFHIQKETGEPGRCKAQPGNCPIALEHFDSLAEARAFYEITATGVHGILPKNTKRETIELSSNIGTGTVVNGDLHDPLARALLSSGLCGDLALAIQKKTGGAVYFLSYTVSDEEELQRLFEEDPDNIVYNTNHVLMESPTKPNHFIDSYGQNSYEDIEENWDAAFVIEGTPEMLQHFTKDGNVPNLDAFADAVLELDRLEERYDVDQDLLESDYDYYDDEE